jgi:hypothetical protein
LSRWVIPHEAYKETVGVAGVKAIRVVQTRIPALRGGPVDCDVDFLTGHRSNNVCTFRHGIPFALIFSVVAGTKAVANAATNLLGEIATPFSSNLTSEFSSARSATAGMPY